MKSIVKLFIVPVCFLILFSVDTAAQSTTSPRKVNAGKTNLRWPVTKANQWYQQNGGWLVGCNFTPANAINQLEMWQAASFDTSRINLELAWAQKLGFNVVRVFLHDVLWEQDSTGFLGRMDQFLQIANRHGIGAMFVIFDGCWNPAPHAGEQPAPKPFVHNSGWLQSPGAAILSDTTKYDELRNYLQGVMRHFKNDSRVKLWDLFNEPDNDNGGRFANDLTPTDKYKYSFILLKDAFQWAREVNPFQPLTAAPWRRDWSVVANMDPMDRFMFDHSDVISFHAYDSLPTTSKKTKLLQRYGRPLVCSEYMARPTGSTFQQILPFFKKERVSAMNWGFVSGKTQTIYPWDSWTQNYTAPPKLWFHDIFQVDGTPFDREEVKLIKGLSGVKKGIKASQNKNQITWSNPVWDHDFPDPTIITAPDGSYYAYATQGGFNGQKAHIQVAQSKDGITWHWMGDALPEKPSWAGNSKNFWAPHALYDRNNKRYVLYYAAESDADSIGMCIGVAVSATPKGPFIDKGTPLLCGKGFEAIDAMAFHDPVSRKNYLYWGSDFKPIRVQQLSGDWMRLAPHSSTKILLTPVKTQHYEKLIEGPWVIYNHGYYFLFYSGDNCCGINAHYAVMLARSRHADGPYERFSSTDSLQSAVILQANDQWLAPGHNSVVSDTKGNLWMYYHAISSQDFKKANYQRVMLRDQLSYKNGWLQIPSGTPSVEKQENGADQ